MPTHIIDSVFFRDLYGTAAMRAVFDDRALLQRWLDAEAALARAEAELGLIPRAAAREIARAARAGRMNIGRIRAGIEKTVHPLVPVIRELARHCRGGAGEFIHWGATTQDIMDTANVLQLTEAYAILDRRLDGLAAALSALARRHRDAVMAGRTHGQQALPITFGFKAAVWLAEVRRHRERLAESRPRVLVGQFAGAVGTLASVPEKGLAIQRRMMKILGLGVPPIAWHTARDGFAEFASILGMIAATMGKIAHEVILLQKTETAEVEEPFNTGKVGSSTMPHKRNPMLCEAVCALARLVMRQVPAALDGMLQEHERDMGPWQMEWAYLPEACVMADGALALTDRVVRGLRVDAKRMRRNLDALGGLMLSEAVMLELAKTAGRQTAHDVVYECSMKAFEEGRPFADVLAADPRVAKHLTRPRIARLLDPARYTGLAGTFVDRVAGRHS
jgi:adenylosuccinate lyase